MTSFFRPIVLLSTITVLQAFITLYQPSKFGITLVFSFVIALLFFFAFLKKRRYLSAVVFFAVIIFGAINPMTSYIKHQKSAEDFTDSHVFSKDSVFKAEIYDCKNYTGYSVIDANLLEYNGNDIPYRFKCRINCYSSESYRDGDIITFSGIPEKSRDIVSDTFDTAAYLKSKGIFVNFDNAVFISSSAKETESYLYRLRSYTQKIVYKYIGSTFDFSQPSVCYALISGDKDFIDDNLKTIFSTSGTTHLLCVSGMHLSVILGTIYAILSLLTLHKRTKTVLVIIIGFLYTVFSGFALSTLRAAIISTITFTAALTGKKTDAFKSLFFAMLIIVLLSPYAVFDISAQLSFCATLGILAFSLAMPKIKENGLFSRLLNTFISCLACNIGAVVFTLPVSAYSFSGFSTVSAPATLFVSFAFQILLMSVLMLLLLSLVSGFGIFALLCESLGSICTLICNYIIKVCTCFSLFKYSYISSHSRNIVFIFSVLLLLYVIFVFLDFKRAQKFITTLTLFCVICFSFFSLYSAIYDDYEYKVSYYRKNENDRQLSIKLANIGYLLVNADNKLCTDKNFDGFDRKNKNNFLLIIPDPIIIPQVLIQNIKEFDTRFGIKEIFLPDNKDAGELSTFLEEQGINYKLFPKAWDFGKFTLEFDSQDFYRITIDDTQDKTCIVFAENYEADFFDESRNICAYFTRKAQNNFKTDNDTIHANCLFYTRLTKGQEHEGIINTYGQKIITIKE